MPSQSNIEFQLKEAGQLAEETAWSALVEREAGSWHILESHHLPKKNQASLLEFLSKAEVDSWLCGAVSGRQSRSVSLPESSGLETGRLNAFPLVEATRVILVGANQLSSASQRLWRLIAFGMNGNKSTADTSATASVAASLLVPDLDSENPFDMPRALDRALTSFIRLVAVQGAWLAVRRGDSLEIRAQWNAPHLADTDLLIDANPLLRRMNRNLTPMVVNRDDALWAEIPHKGLKSNTKLWACIPIVIGQRVIGSLAFWRTSIFKHDEWNRLIDLVTQSAPVIETIITFAEMASHLRRLAMLNAFALTVSSGRNLDQIARRMFALLARGFGTELIALFLLCAEPSKLGSTGGAVGKPSKLGSTGTAAPAVLSSPRTLRRAELAPLCAKPSKLGSTGLGAKPSKLGSTSTSVPWTCCSQSGSAGSPRCSRRSARLRATAVGSSPPRSL